MSFVTYYLQEGVVPYAEDQLTEIENGVINHVSAFNRDLTVSAPLPGGGRQVTIATAYEPHSRALLHVTLIQYDNHNDARQIVFADRAEFSADKWTLENSSLYRFNADGTTTAEPHIPQYRKYALLPSKPHPGQWTAAVVCMAQLYPFAAAE